MWLAPALALMLAATACSGGGASSDSKPTSLVIGISEEPGSLNMLRDTSDASELINWSLTEPLFDTGDQSTLIPKLATKAEQDAQDSKTWHVTLRPDVTFTDGAPFNAEAVKQNIDMILDPAYASTAKGFETLKGATVVDDLQVDLQTTLPDPYLMQRMQTIRFESPKAATDPDAFGQHPIGTGAYEFASWDKGQRITLKQNPDWWGEAGQMKTVEFRFIPDTASRISALQAGEIDMANALTTDDAKSVPQLLKSANNANGTTLRFNMEAPAPYNNLAFRQALAYAIDREAIAKNLFGGLAAVEKGQMLPPGSIGYNDSLEGYPYDPEKAKELLSTVTLPAGFAVTMSITSGVYPKDNEIGQAIAADWQAIGLKTNVRFQSSDKWLDDVVAGGDNTSPDSPLPLAYIPLDYYGVYASRIANRLYNRHNSISAVGDNFPELDKLFTTAESSSDAEESEAAYRDIFKLANDQLLNIPVVDYPDLWGATDKVDYTPGEGIIQRIRLEQIHVS